MSNDLYHQSRTRVTVAYSGLAIAGIAALALVTGATAAPHSERVGKLAPASARESDAKGTGQHEPPAGTKAESLRVARRLLSLAVLPPGTRLSRGKRLPAGLRGPAGEYSAEATVDVHKVFTERESMQRTVRFLSHHHPAGWQWNGSGKSSGPAHGTTVVFEEDVDYQPKRTAPQFSAIQMMVEVVPGHDGHAQARVDVQVIWYPPRSAAEHLTASQYDAVTVEAWFYGTSVRHAKRTFRQQAIIDKLTRVLNSEPASPGGIVNCPAELVTYQLTFKPVKGQPGATVTADGCLDYGVAAGGHPQPSLVDNNKVESVASHLMRKHHGKSVHEIADPPWSH